MSEVNVQKQMSSPRLREKTRSSTFMIKKTRGSVPGLPQTPTPGSEDTVNENKNLIVLKKKGPRRSKTILFQMSYNVEEQISYALVLNFLTRNIYQDQYLDERVKDYIFSHFTFMHNLQEKIKPEIMNDVFLQLKYERVDKFQTLFNAGDIGRKMYFILEGEIGILIAKRDEEVDNLDMSPISPRNMESGLSFQKFCERQFPRMKLVNVLGKNQDFGQVALEHRIPRTATCVAKTKTDLMVLTYETYRKTIAKYFGELQERKIEFLRKIPFFSQVSSAALQILLSNCQVQTFTFNSFLFQEFDVADQVFIVKEGCVSIQKLENQYIQSYEQEVLELDEFEDNVDMQTTQKKKDKHFYSLHDAGPGEMIGHYEIVEAYFKDRTLISANKELPKRVYRAVVKEQATVLILSAAIFLSNCKQMNYEKDLRETEKNKQFFRQILIKNHDQIEYNMNQDTKKKSQGFDFELLIKNNFNGVSDFSSGQPGSTSAQHISKPIQKLFQRKEEDMKKGDFSKQLYQDVLQKYSFTNTYQANMTSGDPHMTIRSTERGIDTPLNKLDPNSIKGTILNKKLADHQLKQLQEQIRVKKEKMNPEMVFKPDPTDPQYKNLAKQLENFKNKISKLRNTKQTDKEPQIDRQSYIIYSPRKDCNFPDNRDIWTSLVHSEVSGSQTERKIRKGPNFGQSTQNILESHEKIVKINPFSKTHSLMIEPQLRILAINEKLAKDHFNYEKNKPTEAKKIENFMKEYSSNSTAQSQSPLKVMFFSSEQKSPISGDQGYKFYPQQKVIAKPHFSPNTSIIAEENKHTLCDEIKQEDDKTFNKGLLTSRGKRMSMALNKERAQTPIKDFEETNSQSREKDTLLHHSRDQDIFLHKYKPISSSSTLTHDSSKTSFQKYLLKNQKEPKNLGVHQLNMNLPFKKSLYQASQDDQQLSISKTTIQAKSDHFGAITPRTNDISSVFDATSQNYLKINDLNSIIKLNSQNSQEGNINQFFPSNMIN